MDSFRKLKGSDYSKGVIELLSQLSTIDKLAISKRDFVKWVSELNAFHSIYVFERDDKIVAIGTILMEPKLIHNFGLVAHIEDIVVDSSCRNTGLGKLLIKFLTDIAEKQGCYKVILDCSDKNIEFYQKCGYKPHGVEMAHYFE
jgi:glucosamine-phosphate N-acetyltransferase